MALVSGGSKSKALVPVCSDEALRNLWWKTEGQMGLYTSKKMGQKSFIQVYSPAKGIDPSVRAGLHLLTLMHWEIKFPIYEFVADTLSCCRIELELGKDVLYLFIL